MAPDRREEDGPRQDRPLLGRLEDWGSSSLPPALLASLITALHARPAQPLGLLLAPPLLFASYLNLSGFPTAAAGASAAWSGLYALLALRRRQPLRARFLSARGLVRGAAVGMGGVNAAAGGWVYAKGSFEGDERERVRRNRWGGGK